MNNNQPISLDLNSSKISSINEMDLSFSSPTVSPKRKILLEKDIMSPICYESANSEDD